MTLLPTEMNFMPTLPIPVRNVFKIGLLVLVAITATPRFANPCPFCAGVQPSFLDELNDVSEFHIAVCIRSMPHTDEPGLFLAEFEVVEPLKSITEKKNKTTFTVPTFESLAAKKMYLVKGYGEETEFQWVAPVTIERNDIEYLRGISQLATGTPTKLAKIKFFFDHRDSPSTLIADDCFNELGKTSIEDLQLLKPYLQPEKLKDSLRNEKHTTDRKRLDWVLLGICGQATDAAIFDELLDIYYKQRELESKTGVLIRESIGLDAAISTYITLLGERGLTRVESEFLTNPKSEFSDVFSTLLALRVQGDDIKKLSQERLAESMALVLQRPEMADLVVSDLARWQQWKYCKALLDLYNKSEKDELRLRLPIINYLRVCPLPEAQEALEAIRVNEPLNYRRAQTLFPQAEKASSK